TPDGGSETSRRSEQQAEEGGEDEAPHRASYRAVDSDQSMRSSSVLTEKGRKNDIPAAQKNTIGGGSGGSNSRGAGGAYAANAEEEDDDQIMRQSMLAEAMGSRLEPADYTRVRRNTTAAATASGIPPSLLGGQQQQQQHQRLKQINAVSSLNNRGLRQLPSSLGRREEKQAADSLASSLSFSDLSASSLTESAMQDALLSEAMNASTTMSSILGSRRSRFDFLELLGFSTLTTVCTDPVPDLMAFWICDSAASQSCLLPLLLSSAMANWERSMASMSSRCFRLNSLAISLPASSRSSASDLT
ncbi:hypothetical protein GGH99_008787, partial [Coemansia sp. RSA 1285]